MGIAVAIALGALFASIAPLFAMWITFKQHTESDYERGKNDRIRQLESELESCRDENIRLMRQLLGQK